MNLIKIAIERPIAVIAAVLMVVMAVAVLLFLRFLGQRINGTSMVTRL